jgi:hypothetical protein
MYVIELILKNVSTPISVQRKEAADAEQLYRQLSDTIKGPTVGHMIELTCEHQIEKKIIVDATEVVAIQTYSKSGAPASGRATGFASSSTSTN